MSPEFLSTGVLFLLATAAVMLSIEAGYRMGRRAHKRSEDEKESPVSAIAGSVLGLVAFMLAFTFGIVAQRYDTKKSLVREEANTIRTTWMRSDFLPEPDRSEAAQLLRQYVHARLEGITMIQNRKVTLDHMEKLLAEADQIQRRLWEMAVVNARKDMNSDVAALYVESLNALIEIHVSRVTIGMQQRIPAVIWIVLAGLTFCGMVLVGYQTGIAGSKRSSARPFLAISFSMVVALISSLDRPGSLLTVSQRPLMDLRDAMDRGPSGVNPSH